MTDTPPVLMLIERPSQWMMAGLEGRYALTDTPGPGTAIAITGGGEGIDAATIDACPDLKLIAVCAVSGVFAGVLNPIIGTEMVRLVPERLRSRVFGAVTSGVLVAVPLGGLLGGYVVQYAGLRTGMAAVSAVYLLTTLSPLVLPAFRSWDTPAAPAPRVAAPSSA